MIELKSRLAAGLVIAIFQSILITIFIFCSKFDDTSRKEIVGDANDTTVLPDSKEEEPSFLPSYPYFQDIHVMVFVGFGFLMTFLKKYAFSALGFSFLISSIVIEWAIIMHAVVRFHSITDKIVINLTSMIIADIIAAVILISFGAVLGKVSPMQLFIMAVLETVLFIGNEYLCTEVLKAVDAGGSVYVHVFGAYFGLAASFILSRGVSREAEENNLESSYQSDISSMIGTFFLWLFWPSFSAGLLPWEDKSQAIVNTYLALIASCITTFIMLISYKEKKFRMVFVQNATLAGGVGVGTVVNIIDPSGALVLGALAAFFSVIGFQYVQGFLHSKLRIHDTCGINNLHGIPGVIGGIAGTIVAGMSDLKDFEKRLDKIFPARGFPDNRSAAMQAGFQFAALWTTLGISIAGGLLTGVVIRYFYPQMLPEDYYKDDIWWETPENTNNREL